MKGSRSVGPNGTLTKDFSINQRKNLYPFSKLIKKSFSTDCFPIICKTTKVILIFKTESRLLCNNYKPVSSLLNVSKTMEELMH